MTNTTEALARPLQAAPRRLSTVLLGLDEQSSDAISLGELVSALHDRSFAPLMVIFAAPNVLLFIPGSSLITGLPLIVIAWQLVCGRPSVWLPGFLSARSIDHARFSRIVSAVHPWVLRVERLARPRYWPASYLVAEGAAGCAALVMATFMFLPIPFANTLPAISVIMLAMGLGERDGLWLAGGLLLALISTVLVIALLGAGAAGVLTLVT